jgi:c-di-GMP-binding flagellar brake protein YcgR
LQTGDVVRVDLVIPADARYVVDARVRLQPDGSFVLDLRGEWMRVQRREYFRIRTGVIPVRVVRERARRKPTDERSKSWLFDVSGGGALVETNLPLEQDEYVHVKFELPLEPTEDLSVDPDAPQSVIVDLPVRVVRVDELDRGRRRRVGLRFGAIPQSLRTEILGWVYALQARRRAREVDATFDAFDD